MPVLCLVAALSFSRAAGAQETAPAPPVAEARPRTVYLKLTGGRRIEGRLVGHDDDAHWIETADGVVRVRMADVATMSDTPPAATAASLPTRWDPRPFLTITGSILFGLAYLGAVSGIDDGGEDGFHLAIPILGPFAYAMVIGAGAEQAGLLTFACFLQAGGLAMLTFGIAGGPPAPFTSVPE